MFVRAPKLFHLVLIAACSVAVAVILTMWHINGITDRVLTGMYHKLKKRISLVTLDANSLRINSKKKSQKCHLRDQS